MVMKITMVLHILYDDITVITRIQREQAAKKELVTYSESQLLSANRSCCSFELGRGWGVKKIMYRLISKTVLICIICHDFFHEASDPLSPSLWVLEAAKKCQFYKPRFTEP